MHRITNSGRVNLGHLFWLRSLAIIGQLSTIAVVQIFYGAKLPLPAMLLVIALEMVFNGLTWLRVARAQPETNLELFGQMWVDLGALSALLFLSGGATNPFVTLYIPSLAIAAAVLPWTMRWAVSPSSPSPATRCSATTTCRSISRIRPISLIISAPACG